MPKTAVKKPVTKKEAVKKPAPKAKSTAIKVSACETLILEKLAKAMAKKGMDADALSKATKLAKAQLPKAVPTKNSPSFRNMITVANALGYEFTLKKLPS